MVLLLRIQTDLGAAWSTAHIRPVLLVIHVIGKPGKMQKKPQKTNKNPKKNRINLAAFSRRVWIRGAAPRPQLRRCFIQGEAFLSLPWIFNHTETTAPVKLHPEQQGSGHPPVSASIVEAMCNNSRDDGCSTPRHNIISGKMIRLMPAGAKLPLPAPALSGGG